MRLYGIKDTKAGIVDVYISNNNATAIRFFSDLAKNERHYVGNHAEDYELYSLGEIDEAGNIKPELAILEQAINLK